MYNTRTENLDALLSIICEELQLPTSEYDRAEEHYVAVGHWLDAEGSLLRSWKPVIYPQGSFRIGTTVKPLKEDEFDLDLVCELQLGEANIAPLSVLDMVERRLRDHGTYHNMIERKRRCVRLTYAHEFHLDILPARPDGQASGTRVRIPDGDLSMWLPSDPRGYARWFEGQAERIKLARVEPVPDQESVAEKSSLQRAVQLLKRWRDLAYQDNTDVAPRSIVLTTLAGECVVEATSTSAALREIIDGITIRVGQSPYRPIVVRNPVHPAEILSEQWERNPGAYDTFVERLAELAGKWQALETGTDVFTVERILSQLFGDGVTKQAFVREAAQVETHRTDGSLGVTRSTRGLSLGLGSGIVPVRRNTFYGDT